MNPGVRRSRGRRRGWGGKHGLQGSAAEAHLALHAQQLALAQSRGCGANVDGGVRVLPGPLELQRRHGRGKAVHHQHHLPRPQPANRASRPRRTRDAALGLGVQGRRARQRIQTPLLRYAPRSRPRGIAIPSTASTPHLLVLEAPLTRSPLCCLSLRAGLTVYLRRGECMVWAGCAPARQSGTVQERDSVGAGTPQTCPM